MKIVNLMIGEFIDHIKSNFITAFLMSVVSLILIVFLSLFLFQSAKLKPFLNLGIENGFMVQLYGDNLDLDEMETIENVYYLNRDGGFIVDGPMCVMLGYEKWIWNEWKCGLKSGKWFTESGVNESIASGEMPIIIGGKYNDVAVGDLLEGYTNADYYRYDGQTHLLKMRVIGIVNDDAGIICDNGVFSAGDMSYESLFATCDKLIEAYEEPRMVVMFPMDCIKGKDISMDISMKFFLEYKDGLTEKEIEDTHDYIYQHIEGCGLTIDEFKEDSNEKLVQIVLTYIPFIVIGVLILLVSMYALSYLTVAKCTNHLAVYTVLGSSRKTNYIIILGNAVGTIVMSLIMFVVGLQFYQMYVITHQIAFVLTENYRVIVGIAYLVFFVFMSLCIYLAFRKKTTRGMLISLHK